MGDAAASLRLAAIVAAVRRPFCCIRMICPGRLAHQGCAVVDPDYPVVLGQLGYAGALLLAELYGCHVLSSRVGWSSLPLRELGPRVPFCFVQVQARSATTSASTAPKVSGSAPLPTASSGRPVPYAPCKTRSPTPDPCTRWTPLSRKAKRATDQSRDGQRVTANSFRSLSCNTKHSPWPRIGDRYRGNRSAYPCYRSSALSDF